MNKVNYNGRTSLSNYVYCCIRSEGLYDAQRDLLAIAKLLVYI